MNAPVRNGFVRPLVLAALAAALLLPGAPLRGAETTAAEVTFDFYRTLAESGSPDAQLTLGDLYRDGEGVSANLIEAYAWYYLAAQQGLEEAIQPMNDVLRALPAAQWPKARSLAEDYERRFVTAHP